MVVVVLKSWSWWLLPFPGLFLLCLFQTKVVSWGPGAGGRCLSLDYPPLPLPGKRSVGEGTGEKFLSEKGGLPEKS